GASWINAVSASRVVLDDQLHFTGHGDLGALGTTDQTGLQLVELDLEVARNGREHLGVTAGRCHLEGLGALAAGLDVDELTRLHTEGRAVDELAVDHDVTVHDHLTGLCGGAGEAGAKHEGVQTHLEQLDQVLTGQAVDATGLVERDAQLLLADAVLLAKTLLLTQTDGVVAVGLALGAAVLARSVGTLLEVAGSLRGECHAEGAGQTDLAAVLGLRDHEVFLPMTWTCLSRLTDVSESLCLMHARRGAEKVGCERRDARKLCFEPLKSNRSRPVRP